MKIGRRAAISGALVAAAGLLLPRRAAAAEYASAGTVFDAIDRFEADVAARLRLLARSLGSARPFVASVMADHERHRRVRTALRSRLGLGSAPAGEAPASDASLEGLRAAQEALVYAHAEGMPALGDDVAVDGLSRNMVELARHLTIVDLWIEAEAARG